MEVKKIVEQPDQLDIRGAILLSATEARKYLNQEDREYPKWWWLRTPGFDTDLVAEVDKYGYVNTYGYYVESGFGCVRPALRVYNLSSSNFEIGDCFKIGKYDFKIISDGLAWLYRQDIGYCAFKAEWHDETANVYEESEVRKMIDNWFENLINE